MIIVLHHSVAIPIGTGAITPISTSLSRDSLTCFLKWKGTGIGECRALGMAPSFRWIWAGGPEILGNGADALNADALNLSYGCF